MSDRRIVAVASLINGRLTSTVDPKLPRKRPKPSK